MSMMGIPSGRSEVGETVASFPTYEAAQKAVSSLIAGEVPAKDIAIVGIGLRSIERITGRLGYATAARQGAINGVLLGLLFSAFIVLGTPSVPIQAFVGVIFVGIAIGMLLSLITYSLIRRRRDFASVMQVVADHYEVTVMSSGIQRARQLLGPGAVLATPPATSDSAPPAPAESPAQVPPQYGERLPAPPQGGGPVTPGEAPGPVSPPVPQELPPGPASPPVPGEPSPIPTDSER
jgi:hypothetical protein